MNNNTIATLVALTLVATAMAPLAVASLAEVDDSESTQAPAGVHIKEFGSSAVAFCQLVDNGVPLACDPNPGTIPALGGAFFNVTAWNADGDAAGSYGREVEVWVEQIGGQSLGGFAALGCTDFNDDIECDSGSNGFAGNGDDVCDGVDDKDVKDCDDPSNLSFTFCAEKDDYPYTLIHDNGTTTEEYDDDYDDFVVFVTWWSDVRDSDAGGLGLLTNDNDNTGAGLSFGQFRVDADYKNYQPKAACQDLNDFVVDHDAGDNTGANWQGAATVVGGGDGPIDQGVMGCGATSGNGQGGFCIHDNTVDAVYVEDDDPAIGANLAFQVCRDLNPVRDPNGTVISGTCTDAETLFSHNIDPNGIPLFENPVAVPGPDGQGQIVVFICAGVHSNGAVGAHEHRATQGFGEARPSGGGFNALGGFCGGSPTVGDGEDEQGGKAYVIRAP